MVLPGEVAKTHPLSRHRLPKPKCVIAGCGKEVEWNGPTCCAVHSADATREDGAAQSTRQLTN